MVSSNSRVIISKKRQKLTNQGENSVDRISNLPDSVLLHIMSFLPTKNAVATGLLSKRWEFLWTNVPSLDFEHNLGKDSENKSFSNFVNRFLLHHNAKSILKFNVKFGSKIDRHDVQSWVFMAISRNVQELNIANIPLGGLHSLSFDLPRCVFTCKTLVSLKLCGRLIRIRVPASVCLPNLKTLDLDSVIYQDDESVCKLISSCFVLENLSIRPGFDNVEKFLISAAALKRLKIDFAYSNGSLEYVLEINGPALEYLDMKDYISKILVVTNLSSLIKADVHFSYHESLMKCLEAFSNARFFSLSGFASMRIFYFEPGLLSTKFLNLAHLSIGASLWHPLLRYFLESSDNLEVLKIKSAYFGSKNDDIGWIEPEHVPRCLSSVRAISIENFQESEDEFAMLKYILKNGKVLETVQIHHIDSRVAVTTERITSYKTKKAYEFEEKFHIVQKILKFPRGSEALKLRLREISSCTAPCATFSICSLFFLSLNEICWSNTLWIRILCECC